MARSEGTGGRLIADTRLTPQAANNLPLGLRISLATVENIGLRAQKHARSLRRNSRPGTCPHKCMALLPCDERLIPMGEVQLILPCAPTGSIMSPNGPPKKDVQKSEA